MKLLPMLLLGATLCAAAEPVRIGTYNSRALALAFYRSETWAAVLKAKMAERDTLRKAGNTAKAEELEKWGQAQQDLAHRQVFGEAPIPNVLEAIRQSFPAVAQAARVSAIAPSLQYTGTGVEQVDVTLQIVETFKPDERTRKMVREFLDKLPPPVDAPHRH
jgi:hypothetical protein